MTNPVRFFRWIVKTAVDQTDTVANTGTACGAPHEIVMAANLMRDAH